MLKDAQESKVRRELRAFPVIALDRYMSRRDTQHFRGTGGAAKQLADFVLLHRLPVQLVESEQENTIVDDRVHVLIWLLGDDSDRRRSAREPAEATIRALKACPERSEGRRLGEVASPEGLRSRRLPARPIYGLDRLAVEFR